MTMKNGLHRYDINRHKARHGNKYTKNKRSRRMICLFVLSNAYAAFEAQFIKKLTNTEAELKKSVACKKVCLSHVSIVKKISERYSATIV